MRAYFLRRILLSIPTLVVVASLVFVILHAVPGDTAAVMAGPESTEEQVQAIRERLGLHQPLPVQYWRYLSNAARGDLGASLYSGRTVIETIASRLEPTLLLTLLALCIAIAAGVPVGILAAANHNGILDNLLMVVILIGLSIPNFWLGINLALLFGLRLDWLPIAGYSFLRDNVAETLQYLTLPALALSTGSAALIARVTRTGMLEILNQDYVRTAKAMGARRQRILFRHAFRNAVLPVVTVVGFTIPVLIGGAVVVESVFAIPGLGRLLTSSILRRDYPVVQGALVLIAAAYVLINLAVDMLYAVIDPRIRYS